MCPCFTSSSRGCLILLLPNKRPVALDNFHENGARHRKGSRHWETYMLDCLRILEAWSPPAVHKSIFPIYPFPPSVTPLRSHLANARLLSVLCYFAPVFSCTRIELPYSRANYTFFASLSVLRGCAMEDAPSRRNRLQSKSQSAFKISF